MINFNTGFVIEPRNVEMSVELTITYTDPITQESMTVVKTFTAKSKEDAYEQAEDYGYMLAIKGYYKVT